MLAQSQGFASWLTAALSALLLFFIYRLVKKNEAYSTLETKFHVFEESMNLKVQSLNSEIAKASVDAKSLAEVHQVFGQIKMMHKATFNRIDELRDDFKEYKNKHDNEINDLRKKVYAQGRST